MSSVLGASRSEPSGLSAMRWLPIVFGLLVMYVPTYVDLWRAYWTLEDNAHGPLIVAVVAWLFPVVLALFEPVLDGLLYAVLLVVFEVLPEPVEEEAAFADAELEEPLWLWLAVRASEAVRLSLAVREALADLVDEDCSWAPMEVKSGVV